MPICSLHDFLQLSQRRTHFSYEALHGRQGLVNDLPPEVEDQMLHNIETSAGPQRVEAPALGTLLYTVNSRICSPPLMRSMA